MVERQAGARSLVARADPLAVFIGVVDGSPPVERGDAAVARIFACYGCDAGNLRAQNHGLVVERQHSVHAQLDLVGEPGHAGLAAHAAQDEPQAHPRNAGEHQGGTAEHQHGHQPGGQKKWPAHYPAGVEHPGDRHPCSRGVAGVPD